MQSISTPIFIYGSTGEGGTAAILDEPFGDSARLRKSREKVLRQSKALKNSLCRCSTQRLVSDNELLRLASLDFLVRCTVISQATLYFAPYCFFLRLNHLFSHADHVSISTIGNLVAGRIGVELFQCAERSKLAEYRSVAWGASRLPPTMT